MFKSNINRYGDSFVYHIPIKSKVSSQVILNLPQIQGVSSYVVDIRDIVDIENEEFQLTNMEQQYYPDCDLKLEPQQYKECQHITWNNEVCTDCGQMREMAVYVDQRKFSFHKKPPMDKIIKDQIIFAEFKQRCLELFPTNTKQKDYISEDVLAEVFRQIEIVMKQTDIKGNKLFKLYLYMVSYVLRQLKGRVVISKQISIITGIQSLPDYHARWFYQGHKLFQQFNFSFNPNMLGTPPIPLSIQNQ